MSVSIISKRPAGVQRFVDEIIVNTAMERVGSRLHRHVEQTTARLTEFSREVAGLDCDFLNSFDALLCLRDLTVADRGGSILPIDAQPGGVALHSVHAHRLIR